LKRFSGGSAFDAVTIIGSKYHAGAHDYVRKASQIREPEEQCLFLVLDTKSEDVLLHNGKDRLGIVAPHQKEALRQRIKLLAKEEGSDHVLVCKKAFVSDTNAYSFASNSSFNVEPVYSVYERLARKYADKYRKGK
jgi:hypothetical protein